MISSIMSIVPSPSASPRPSSNRKPLKIVRSKLPTTMDACPRAGASVNPATARGVPPYVIFSDATLLELAARKPRTLEEFATVKGVGEKKLADLGETFLAAIGG